MAMLVTFSTFPRLILVYNETFASCRNRLKHANPKTTRSSVFYSMLTCCFTDSLTVMFGVGVMCCHGSPYSARSQGLTSVPVDIPPEATSVELSWNQITNLTSGVFSHLIVCVTLNLYHNGISLVESGAFTGLTVLK